MIVREDEYLDFSQVPESRGIPQPIRIAGMVGLLMIFGIGAAVCLCEGYGHVWPAAQSMRVDLGTFHQ